MLYYPTIWYPLISSDNRGSTALTISEDDQRYTENVYNFIIPILSINDCLIDQSIYLFEVSSSIMNI